MGEMIERTDMVFVGNLNPNINQAAAEAEIMAWAPGKIKRIDYSKTKKFAHVTFVNSAERKKFIDKKIFILGGQIVDVKPHVEPKYKQQRTKTTSNLTTNNNIQVSTISHSVATSNILNTKTLNAPIQICKTAGQTNNNIATPVSAFSPWNESYAAKAARATLGQDLESPARKKTPLAPISRMSNTVEFSKDEDLAELDSDFQKRENIILFLKQLDPQTNVIKVNSLIDQLMVINSAEEAVNQVMDFFRMEGKAIPDSMCKLLTSNYKTIVGGSQKAISRPPNPITFERAATPPLVRSFMIEANTTACFQQFLISEAKSDCLKYLDHKSIENHCKMVIGIWAALGYTVASLALEFEGSLNNGTLISLAQNWLNNLEHFGHKCAINSRAIVDFTLKFLHQEHTGNNFVKANCSHLNGLSTLGPMTMPPPGFLENQRNEAPHFNWPNSTQETNDESVQNSWDQNSSFSNLISNSKPVNLGRGSPPMANTSRVATSDVPKRRRPIIIDGCNVAFQHGLNDRYSAKGLQLVYQYFVNTFGYENSEITIINKFVYMLKEDKDIVDYLYKTGVLIYSPSRKVGDQNICSNDDRMILDMAKQKNGVVISRDNFRDAYLKYDEGIDEVIKYRILQVTFKEDEVWFPDDPLGPNGPSLEEFLMMDADDYNTRNRSYSPKIEEIQKIPLEEVLVSKPEEPHTPKAVMEEPLASKAVQEECELLKEPQTLAVAQGPSKSTYVKVKGDGFEDIYEFPVNESGDLEINALADVFQGITALLYRTEIGTTRSCRKKSAIFEQPEAGWGETIYTAKTNTGVKESGHHTPPAGMSAYGFPANFLGQLMSHQAQAVLSYGFPYFPPNIQH